MAFLRGISSTTFTGAFGTCKWRQDYVPARRFPVAKILLNYRQTNRRIKLHPVHPPPLTATEKRDSWRVFCAAATVSLGRYVRSINERPLPERVFTLFRWILGFLDLVGSLFFTEDFSKLTKSVFQS